MIVYCDTSFVLSYLRPEDVNHKAARKLAERRPKDDFVVCEVHLLEVPAAIRVATHLAQNSVPVHVARTMLNKFDRAANGGLFLRKSLNITEAIAMARSLGETYGWKQRHTAFDLWHLAAAWTLSAGAFLTFDKRQAAIARKLGMA